MYDSFCDPMDCCPPGSSVHGILQAGILEWVAIFSSRGSSRPRDRTWVSSTPALAGRFFTTSGASEACTCWVLLCAKSLQSCLTLWSYGLISHEMSGGMNHSMIRVKQESKKAALKSNIQKTKIMVSRPITSMAKQWKQWQILFSWAPKSVWIVTTVTWN